MTQLKKYVTKFLYSSILPVVYEVKYIVKIVDYEEWQRNRKNSHQQPLPGSLGKTGRAKAGVNIPLSQYIE
jgi:hypothetical protein